MIMRLILALSLTVFIFSCETSEQKPMQVTQEKPNYDPSLDFEAIKAVMAMQEEAWSKGDLEKFMQGYLENETLTFIGSRGLSYGWNTTLENYRKGYPDRAAMGTLSFEVLELKSLSPEYCYMIGQYKLVRAAEDLSGYFTLLWQKVDGDWKVIADQTCG